MKKDENKVVRITDGMTLINLIEVQDRISHQRNKEVLQKQASLNKRFEEAFSNDK